MAEGRKEVVGGLTGVNIGEGRARPRPMTERRFRFRDRYRPMGRE